jgi:SAM-dependent methyltransferase
MTPLEDASRWNIRYITQDRQTFEQARAFLLLNQNLIPPVGIALDLAMGLGGNSGFLLEQGLRVVGVDISDVAVGLAKKKHPSLMAVVADLTEIHFPPACFDLIIHFFYLERSLWTEIPAWLKPGGILIFEALTQEMQAIRPEIQPQFLLSAGELKSAFPGLKTLVYEEGWYGDHHPRATARLIAQKTAVAT